MENFIGEIRLYPYGWPPKGWAMCAGQILAINQNQALFSLLGTQFGGNGSTTFALPDLRGRVARHTGGGLQQGLPGGVESVTLVANNLPQHTHFVMASTDSGDAPAFSNNSMATATLVATSAPPISMHQAPLASSRSRRPASPTPAAISRTRTANPRWC